MGWNCMEPLGNNFSWQKAAVRSTLQSQRSQRGFSYSWVSLFLFVVYNFFSTVASDQRFKFIPNTTDFSYDCEVNLDCLGGAHVGINGNQSFRAFDHMLSLISENAYLSPQIAGLAYHRGPIRMLDPKSGRAVSFNTSFIINQVPQYYVDPINKRAGDGMTFVFSEIKTLGGTGRYLGIFNAQGLTASKSVVVEFDNYMNTDPPMYDINGNHVSFDFSNITTNSSANVSQLGFDLWYNQTVYAWVDYSYKAQLLEVRLAVRPTKPAEALLQKTIDLNSVASEYMYAGFSAANGDAWSHYYIGNWTFNSSGIPYYSPNWKSRRDLVVRLVAGLVGALGGVALLGCLAFALWRHPKVKYWRLGDFVEEEEVLGLSDSVLRRVSYKHLSVATQGFSNECKLGQGGFGSVYKGVLPTTGTNIAVKKIEQDSSQGEREFISEVSIISQLRHRNLIQLLGWCRDRGKYLLVYELMPNGSLDKALFLPEEAPVVLTWEQRFNIVVGAARALDYLHQGFRQQVIHRDIKASNILLDVQWNAKLGDFGLARLVDHLRAAPTTMVAGTYGYIAPEAVFGRFTDKTDVYAFGAVILEVACGRKSLNMHAPQSEVILVDWVWERLGDGNLLSVVDNRLAEYDVYWMEVLLLLGLLCSHPDPAHRPSMHHVVEILLGESAVPSVPSTKPSVTFTSNSGKVSIGDIHHSVPTPVARSLSGNSFLFSNSSNSKTHKSPGSGVLKAEARAEEFL